MRIRHSISFVVEQLPGNQQRLREATGPGKEIVQHSNLYCSSNFNSSSVFWTTATSTYFHLQKEIKDKIFQTINFPFFRIFSNALQLYQLSAFTHIFCMKCIL